MTTRSICVYCSGSSALGAGPLELARTVGRSLALAGHRVVYGGARVGMMGALADAALEAGGAVTGVIPGSLVAREVAHRGLSDLRVVGSMHERKKLMFDESDGFLALPGGFGTLDELFEMVTWRQIQLHAKPVAALNHGGYYDALGAFVSRAIADGYISVETAAILEFVPDLEALGAWLARVPGRADAP